MAFFSAEPQTQFQIFTADYLTVEDKNSVEAYPELALTFTSLGDFEFKQQVSIANEPLENGLFSSDSFHATPFTINITASYTPFIKNKQDSLQSIRSQIADVLNSLDDFLYGDKSNKLLVIMSHYPIPKQYENLKLTSYDYKLTNERNGLVVNLTFQQIIISNAEYGTLNSAKLANPENAPSQDNGMVTTQSMPDIVYA